MTNHRLFITLFICFGLTSLYTSQGEDLAEDDTSLTRQTASHMATVEYKDGISTTTITSFKERILDPQVIRLFISVNSDMKKIRPHASSTLPISDESSSRQTDHDHKAKSTYGTFRSPATDVGGAGAEESTDSQPKCCLFWCIPMCFRNCLKRLCGG